MVMDLINRRHNEVFIGQSMDFCVSVSPHGDVNVPAGRLRLHTMNDSVQFDPLTVQNPPVGMGLNELSHEQLASLLMGLRLLQASRGESRYVHHLQYFDPICSDQEIDDLCDRINWGSYVQKGPDGSLCDFRRRLTGSIAPLITGTRLYLDLFERSALKHNEHAVYASLSDACSAWSLFEDGGAAPFAVLRGDQ